MNRRFYLFYIVIFYLLLAGCQRAEPTRAEFIMGTICRVTLLDQARADVYRSIFSRIRELENYLSVNLPETDVTRINNAAGIEPIVVHDDVFKVIEQAVYYAEISGGAFDPTVGPLVKLWDIGGSNPRVPSQEEIDAVLPLINWRDIELDSDSRSVFLKRPGMAMDLGGIAKGYAADEAAAIVKRAGLKRAIIDLGGNIMMSGVKKEKDKTPWKIGIQNPLENRGEYIGILSVGEQSVVTSGVYERFFEEEGIRYHHIFSPADGYPARNGLLSATVITSVSMDADALSTAAFVLGYEKGKMLIESTPGTEAIFVFEDKSIRKTPGAQFVVTNIQWRVEE